MGFYVCKDCGMVLATVLTTKGWQCPQCDGDLRRIKEQATIKAMEERYIELDNRAFFVLEGRKR